MVEKYKKFRDKVPPHFTWPPNTWNGGFLAFLVWTNSGGVLKFHIIKIWIFFLTEKNKFSYHFKTSIILF